MTLTLSALVVCPLGVTHYNDCDKLDRSNSLSLFAAPPRPAL